MCKEAIKSIVQKYETSFDDMEKIFSYSGYIYKYIKDGKPCILKITEDRHLTQEQLKSEVKWMKFLNKTNGPAVTLVAAKDNTIVQSVEVNKQKFQAFSYEMAIGESFGKKSWDKDLFFIWGKVAGNLHFLAKQYKPESEIRHDWLNDDLLIEVLDNKDDEDKVISERCEAIISKLKEIKKSSDNYGLIHSDLHTGNMIIQNNGEVKVFDFDDCHYDFNIREFAIALYFSFWHPNYVQSILVQSPDDTDFVIEFTKAFLNGYSSENSYDPEMLKYVQDYLKLQRIMLYQILKHDEIDGVEMGDWALVKSKWRQEIIDDKDYVNIDFTKIEL
ncbi:MAG: phosphotransferase [Candidatus Delongbacteria bacterium]|jgi:Ser/Thr protein kinase RdoA (MazF antagonist)|nr:phosphotransferase [Candidatus Delongbacteria bacterium]